MMSCFCFAFTSLLMIAGCGPSGPKTYEVTGTVTYDGKPVEKGEIIFHATDGKGSADVGQIVDGKYTLQATDGPKRVEITATRESSKPAPDGLPNYESYIPKQYNNESTLTAEVKPSGENTFSFDLKPGGR
jgi:hypothetical protein